MSDPNQNRRTPDDLWQVLDHEFRFELDAAADADNARCEFWIDEETNALREGSYWVATQKAGRYKNGGGHTYRNSVSRVFLNPPWSDPSPWLEKAYIEAQKSPSAVVVVVLYYTAGGDVAEWLQKASEIRLLCGGKKKNGKAYTGRPQFVTPGVANSSNPRDVQIVIFRRKTTDTPPQVWFWDWRKGAE